MQQQNGSRTFRIDRPQAAAFLRNPRSLRVLAACIVHPLTLSEIAGKADLPLNSAGRYVERLVAFRIVKIASRAVRAGRAVNRYVAVAPRLFIPSEADDSELPDDIVQRLVTMRVEEQVRGLMAAAAVTIGKNVTRQWGTLIYADRHGSLVVRPDFEGGRTPHLLEPRSPAYLNFYTDDLRLTAEQAKALQRELVALFKRYKAFDGPRPFTLSTVLSPRSKKV